MKKEKESGEKVVTFGGKLRIAKTDRELWQQKAGIYTKRVIHFGQNDNQWVPVKS